MKPKASIKRMMVVLLLAVFMPQWAIAYDFMVDGIAYKINGDGQSVSVDKSNTTPNYKDVLSLNIPQAVAYNGNTYNVTAIYRYGLAGASSVVSLSLPEGLVSIGECGLNGMTALQQLTIPSTLVTIYAWAFENLNNLQSITSLATSAPTTPNGYGWFHNTEALPTCPFYVPNGSLSSYQASEYWNAFNLVEMESIVVFATSVTLNQTVAEITAFESLQLTALVLPDDATDKGVTWSSSDVAVATVDDNGLVTAIAPGTATITATTNDGSNLTASCEITVEATSANHLQVEDQTVLSGNSLTLPVQLINSADNLTALQADIHLPEGITIEMEGDDYVIDLVSERVAGDHALSSNLLASNGAVRILIASPTKKLFKGNDGDLFTISLLTNNDIIAGDYDVTIDNIVLSDNTAATYYAPAASSTITVLDVEMGDATGDGLINVGDYVATASYILEEDPQPFVFAAADIDSNGSIDVGDLVGVTSIILSAESPAGMPAHVAAATGTANLGVICHRTSDGHYQVAVDMSNDINVTAMQMDLSLPNGLKLTDACLTGRASASHAVDFNKLQNGDWRVLAASGSNKSFSGADGVVLTLELEGDGEGLCTLSNIMLAQPNSARIAHDDMHFEIGLATGVNDVYGKVRIYAEGGMLIIESHHDTMAQLVMPNGISQRLNVSAGLNVYRLGNVGYIFVKVDKEVAKFRF